MTTSMSSGGGLLMRREFIAWDRLLRRELGGRDSHNHMTTTGRINAGPTLGYRVG